MSSNFNTINIYKRMPLVSFSNSWKSKTSLIKIFEFVWTGSAHVGKEIVTVVYVIRCEFFESKMFHSFPCIFAFRHLVQTARPMAETDAAAGISQYLLAVNFKIRCGITRRRSESSIAHPERNVLPFFDTIILQTVTKLTYNQWNEFYVTHCAVISRGHEIRLNKWLYCYVTDHEYNSIPKYPLPIILNTKTDAWLWPLINPNRPNRCLSYRNIKI